LSGGLPDATKINLPSSYGESATINFDVSDTIGGITGDEDGTSNTVNISFEAVNLTLNVASGNTLSANTTVSGYGALIKSGSGKQTLSGSIEHSKTITVNAGTLSLTNTSANTYSGNTIISGGTLEAGNDKALGSGKIIMTGGKLSSSDTNPVSFHKGNNSGNQSIDMQGSITLGDSYNRGALTFAGTNTLTGDTTMTVAPMTPVTFSSAIGDGSNAYSLQKDGTGMLTLSGANTYTGTTTVNEGTLVVDGSLNNNVAVVINSGAQYGADANDTIGSIAGAGTLDIASGVTLIIGDDDTNTTFSGDIITSGNLTKIGSGTLTLSGTSTFTGSTTLRGGTIAVSSSANLGATPGSADADNIIFNGGTLQTTADFTLGSNKGITMTGVGTVNVNSSTALTYGGIITGSGVLTKTGSGSLILSGANTNAGAINVNAGTLKISNNSSLGTTDAATVISDGANLEVTSAITSSEAITINGTGVSNSGAIYSSHSSGTANLNGTITLGSDSTIKVNDGNLTFGGSITAGSNNYDLTFTGGSGTIRTSSGMVLNTGSLTMSASGTLFGEQTSNYSGGTTITSGALKYGNNNAFGTGAISMTGGKFYTTDASDFTIDENMNLQGSITLGNSGDNNRITFSGTNTLTDNTTVSIESDITINAITDGSNSYNFTKSGSGTLILAGNSDYNGTTSISAGTLTVTGTLSDDTAVSVSSGATYDIDSNDTIASVDGSGTVNVASTKQLTAGNSSDQTFSGVIEGSGSFLKTGSGTLTLSGTNTIAQVGVYGGTLKVSSNENLGATPGSVDADHIVFNNSAILNTTSSFTLDTTKGITLAGGGEIKTDTSTTLTYSGVIADDGSSVTFTKSGSGDLVLRGSNTFAGTTNISGGTLFAGTSADAGNNILASNVNILSGGTLSGGATVNGNVSSTSGTLAPGNSIGSLKVDGNLTLDNGSTTIIEFNPSSTDLVEVTGNIVLDGTLRLEPSNGSYSANTYTIIDGSSGSGNTLTGSFDTTTVVNSANLGGYSTSVSYNTTLRKVFLTLEQTSTVEGLTTVSSFKDIATVFDSASSGTLLSVANHLKGQNTNTVNTELNKIEGTVLASMLTQPTNNHGYFNKALNNVASISSTSLVGNFVSSGQELTLASLQNQGLYGDKNKFNEYYDYSDTSFLGFVKNNKNRTFYEKFNSEDKATFLRTFGAKTKRDNIGAGYTGYQSETSGILLGEQFKYDQDEFNGYSVGLTHTDTKYNDNYGKADIYSLHASLFKQLDEKDKAFNILTSAYISKTDSARNVKVGSVDDKYKADFYDLGLNLEAQHIKKLNYNGYKISPSFKTSYTYVFKGDTKESGGDLALKVENENLFIVKPEIGLSIGKNYSEDKNITNQIDLAFFASRDYFLEGTQNKARFASGTTFNQDLPRDKETYYSAGLGYNFLNKETDTSIMANLFFIENSKDDISSNIFSITFRKLFGEFGKGRIPPVIATKPNNEEDIIKITLPKNKKDQNNKDKGEEILEELEKNIEIVLKEDPTKAEVAQVYKSINDNLIAKRKLTINDVYNNLSANCYAVENNLVELVNYYSKIQLYKILDKCSRLSEPKVHLIAERLHQIQLDETTALQELYYGYLRFLNYIPFITFVTFIILAYEFVRRYIIDHFKSKKAI